MHFVMELIREGENRLFKVDHNNIRKDFHKEHSAHRFFEGVFLHLSVLPRDTATVQSRREKKW